MIPDPLVDPFGRVIPKEVSDPAARPDAQPEPIPLDEADDQAFRALVARFPLLDEALAEDPHDDGDGSDSQDRVARTLECLARHRCWERIFEDQLPIDPAGDLERLQQAARGLSLIWDHLGAIEIDCDVDEPPTAAVDPAETVLLPPWMRSSVETASNRDAGADSCEATSRADLTLRTLERVVLADHPQAAERLLETVLTAGRPAPILAGPGASKESVSQTEWQAQPIQTRLERGVAWLLDDGLEFEPRRDLARRTLARLDRRLVVGPFTETQSRPIVSRRDGWVAAALVALAVLATLPALVRARDEARELRQHDHLRAVGMDLLHFQALTGTSLSQPAAWEAVSGDSSSNLLERLAEARRMGLLDQVPTSATFVDFQTAPASNRVQRAATGDAPHPETLRRLFQDAQNQLMMGYLFPALRTTANSAATRLGGQSSRASLPASEPLVTLIGDRAAPPLFQTLGETRPVFHDDGHLATERLGRAGFSARLPHEPGFLLVPVAQSDSCSY
ncbi:hypothetical protein Isop_0100 [Isosphaera pallida ATCC 43644]|uniref:Uncharacterized protein n=1 Tax=Isosphaera pallida (strain ATCC 43644 / DSM 9630 / IS1B) TaxID=575540 RepID=E8R5F6_ISOPI|nr:hypothetical protein [Isosphaera pallida]ADV60697.1 hypothetical protein Isop_0100 [Isosphaera pallida ATCC 43644]